MYLLDSNIILEGLLKQNRYEIVTKLFETYTLDKLFISDLSLHSIGIIIFREKKKELFNTFIRNVILKGMEILTLPNRRLEEISNYSKKYHLDFEDAYQLLVARSKNLQLISFDTDFDKVEKLRKEPHEIL